jgi:hypothetical protein
MLTVIPALALSLLALRAQAEPAPPEEAAPPAAVPAPAPAPEPARPVEPLSPTGAAPAPTEEPAAAPAPTPASPPRTTTFGSPERPLPPPPPQTLTILAGFAYRVGDAGTAVGPAGGFSLGGSFEYRYARLAPAVDLGAALDFLFDQFSRGVLGSTPDGSGAEQTFAGTRTVTSTSFALMQTIGTRAGRLHAWGAVGGGLSIGYFSSPEVALRAEGGRSGSSTAFLPMARAALGADIEIKDHFAIGLRAAYSHMLQSSDYTTSAGSTVHLFGDVLDIHAGLFYRF